MANFSDIINASLDLVVPHARREPLNPMAYVRDINEWFVPAAQMALDQMEGTESYTPASYVLASLPVVGKVGKVVGKTAKKPLRIVDFKKLDNDVTRAADEKIKKLEALNRGSKNINELRNRYDKFGTPIGDGTTHANYTVYDIPGTEVTISPSNTSESVYVTYRTKDGKSVTDRFSNHYSNQEGKDIYDILYELGYTEFEPRYETKLLGQNVKKKEIKNYPFSGKTYDELLSLPEDELQKYKGSLIADKKTGEPINWRFDGGLWENRVGTDYYLKDLYEKLFEGYYK